MFADREFAHEFVVQLRWPNGIVCPTCGSKDVQKIVREVYSRSKHPKPPHQHTIWRCKSDHPKREFSAKTGTIFEESPIGFDKWLPAMWLLSANKNGISSVELGKALHLTQKTTWFVLHRIRLAMTTGTYEKLTGEIESDETYVGPKSRSLNRRVSGKKAAGPQAGKTSVMGILQRGGNIRAFVVPDAKQETLIPKIIEHVGPGAMIYTDELRSYHALKAGYVHKVINHAERYVDGNIHTNGVESFWAMLKRAIFGSYIHVDPIHLDRYVSEQVFRFNTRELHDAPRFVRAVRGGVGKRLTYQDLIKRWAQTA